MPSNGGREHLPRPAHTASADKPTEGAERPLLTLSPLPSNTIPRLLSLFQLLHRAVVAGYIQSTWTCNFDFRPFRIRKTERASVVACMNGAADIPMSGRDTAADMPSVPPSACARPAGDGPAVLGLPKSGSRTSLASSEVFPEDVGKRMGIDNSKMVEALPTPPLGCVGATFFSWMDSLVSLGYARNKAGENLQHTDLWELREDLRAQNVVDRFEKFWAEEQAAAKAVGRKAKLESVFWKLTKPWIVASGCFELLRMASQYASPMIIKYIIQYIQVLLA